MKVLFTACVVVCVNLHVESKHGQDLDVDHEDVASIENVNYTTTELRDKVLAEWKGKTDEIQGYFDQLPSEEFKENSEDLKFKYYYERKGVRDIDTNQVFNITPQQPGGFYEPPGPIYTVEVNDSYVPKYRITTSEEERMDKYGTFNSESDSSNVSSEEVIKKKKKKKKKESSETGGEKNKKKTERKSSSSNVDPKEKRKKKPKNTEDKKKRKDLVEKMLNGEKRVRINVKKLQEEKKMKSKDQENLIEKLQGNVRYEYKTSNFLGMKNLHEMKQKMFTKSNKQTDKLRMKKSKVDYKLLDNEEIEKRINNFERRRKHSRQPSSNHVRPFL